MLADVEKSDWRFKDSFILMWDGASAHKSKKTLQFLEERIPPQRWLGGVTKEMLEKYPFILTWPPYSCDL